MRTTSGPASRCGREIATIAADAVRARCEPRLASLLDAIERAVAREVDAGRSAGEPRAACGPGCSACCTMHVGSSALEGFAAATHLRSRLRAEEVRSLAAALLEFHAGIRWMEEGDRIRAGLACPFLDGGGRCSIHPARPLACRAVSSLDPDDCRGALAARADGEDGLVRRELLQKALYDEAAAALAEVLAAAGLDARRRDISGMTGVFLADADLAGRFLAGDRVPLE